MGMPWNISDPVKERTRFVVAAAERETNFTELCRQFGVSREIGYKWLRRYETQGPSGLEEGSHVAKNRPHAMPEDMRKAILDLRRKRPSWGPKKIKASLERSEQGRQEGKRRAVAATSSIGELLRKEGLVHRRRKRSPSAGASTEPLSHAVQPNDVWSIDYKGWFVTGDGKRCDPLTITDNTSRYLIRLTAMPEINQDRVRGVMEAAFRENGLPGAIRSDNGSPFATPAPGGLSQLSIWWIKLGIRHERIEPGKPQQNGRHERFHWSLIKDCLDYEVAWDWRIQQGVFVAYRKEFNEERPHEALGMKTPAEVYRPSAREYRGRAVEMEYGEVFQVRRVNPGGGFLWKGKRVAVSAVLTGERIGLLESDDEVYEVYFGPVMLGWFDGASGYFVRREQAERWKENQGAQGAN